MVALVAPQEPRYSTITPPKFAIARTSGYDKIGVVISGLTIESAFHLAATLQLHPAFAGVASGLIDEIRSSGDDIADEEVAHAS